MTVALHGLGVSRGIAVGRAFFFARDELKFAEYHLAENDIPRELERYHGALLQVRHHLGNIRERLIATSPVDLVSFIETHLLMLDDPVFINGPIQTILEKSCNAEWAVKIQRDALIGVFESMDDNYLRARQDDVDCIVTHLLRALLNVPSRLSGVAAGSLVGAVVVAEDFSPTDVLVLHGHNIAAIVSESGGITSHTAIMARNLGIPAVFGLHNIQRFLVTGETLVVDGRSGLVVVTSDPSLQHFYEQSRDGERAHLDTLALLRDQPSITRDGVSIVLFGNADFLNDVHQCRSVGAAGIGLFRTELLFMERDQVLHEDEQYGMYRDVLMSMEGAPVTIRTLDLSVDKPVAWSREGHNMITSAENPALSLRGIRWCLRESEIFRIQLRAILRASTAGQVRIMFPMLTSIEELKQVLDIVAEVKRQLHARKIPYADNIKIGGMIEVPAAALIAEKFARELDFLSIGTNDLIQYTLAADRTDSAVASLYDPLHPAVLRLIKMTLVAGMAAGIPVSMCGEMAGDTRYTSLLLGLGLREFSMHPALILEIKEAVLSHNVADLMRRVMPLVESADRFAIERFVVETARHPVSGSKQELEISV